MPVPFHRTLRSLEDHDSPALGRVLSAVCGLALLSGPWWSRGEIPIYAISEEARLEVIGAAVAVSSRTAGRLAAVHVSLGEAVGKGDLLVELEASAELSRLAEEEARHAGLDREMTARGRERLRLLAAARAGERAREWALQEARAGVRSRKVEAAEASRQARRVEALARAGLVAEAEQQEALAAEQERQEAAVGAQAAVARVEAEAVAAAADRRVRLAGVERELAELRTRLDVSSRQLERLREELRWRAVVAPVSGRIGELADVAVGSMIGEGQWLGGIVREAELQAVAWFSPAEALGRVKPGLQARVRLEGFPWMEYGELRATVVRVAQEVRGGVVRAELRLEGEPTRALPLQHGLPGTAMVEVERLSPGALLLRSAGKALPKGGRREARSGAR